MKPAGIIGIILIVVGIVALAYGGFSFKEHKKDVDIGPVQIGHTEEHNFPLPPILGGPSRAGGAVLVLVGSRTEPPSPGWSGPPATNTTTASHGPTGRNPATN